MAQREGLGCGFAVGVVESPLEAFKPHLDLFLWDLLWATLLWQWAWTGCSVEVPPNLDVLQSCG